MIQIKSLTGRCPRCGATAEKLAYRSLYTLKNGQVVHVIRCKRRKEAFCDRYGMAFYDLKTPGEKVDSIRCGGIRVIVHVRQYIKSLCR
ncbi:MAG TPA: hypothetical protein VIC84_16255 [Blastocatellia bacterium]|jgi:hypothetical protein